MEILYWVVVAAFIPLTLAGIFASLAVNRTFQKYSLYDTSGDKSAARLCSEMLHANDVNDVMIGKVRGTLTDCYDPKRNAISLSASVYDSGSIAALAVACHEAGHAIQHARGNVFAKFRLAMVPVLNFSNRLLFPILFIGLIFGFVGTYSFVGNILVWIGVVLFGLSMLFSLITLPTEFNASRRALSFIKQSGYTSQEVAAARKVLNAAAMTYVISFLLSLVQFLRFFLILMSRRNRN